MDTPFPQPLASARPLGWGRAALAAGLLAGTLDITAACTRYTLATHKSFANVLTYVASGCFGPAAFTGGAAMAWAGLALHYLIATGFAVAFFLLYPRLALLRGRPVPTGLLYGVAVWLVMNLIIVPLSRAHKLPFTVAGAAREMAILMVCVGLPIAVLAARYYAGAGREAQPRP